MTTSEGMTREVHGQVVHGVGIDAETRCAHWHGPTDVIALRMKCCGRWYPCFDCHAELVEHPPEVWPLAERDAGAVLCGACGAVLGIDAYLGCESTCPECTAAFNPGCALHHHLYFESSEAETTSEGAA
jgi:uncharacterized CHY-type Zn-finger protein